jgi:hypothetical protein
MPPSSNYLRFGPLLVAVQLSSSFAEWSTVETMVSLVSPGQVRYRIFGWPSYVGYAFLNTFKITIVGHNEF